MATPVPTTLWAAWLVVATMSVFGVIGCGSTPGSGGDAGVEVSRAAVQEALPSVVAVADGVGLDVAAATGG